MSYKVHDKFIIEIVEAIKGYGNNPEAPNPLNLPVLYRIKGFNALVFDDFGLDKLEKYEEEKYPPSELAKFRQEAFDAGMKEGWKIAKDCFAEYKDKELDEIFGEGWNFGKIMEYTPQEAKKLIETWEKGKSTINVGDVVQVDDCLGIVLDICSEDVIHVLTENGCVETWWISKIVRTNKYFNIPCIISQLGGVK